MDNQHTLIKGYRDLNEQEIALMNQIKTKAEEVRVLTEKIGNTDGTDKRWLAIGITDLQKGFMAITRSVAKPTSF